MDTSALKRFAQAARNLLIDQVTAKLAVVVDPASSARRENPGAMRKLDEAIGQIGQTQVIEQVAYTWFNRFTALRFMDVNGYTNPRVVSPEGEATRPELLAEAIAGNLPEGAPATIAALLDGRTPSRDPQGEAYRLLLVHACNAWHATMPFMFEKVGDYTELLMPEDLLSQTSILARLRDAMPEDDCKDVEIIGWLYQFYISEKKDQVFAGLKKNQKITAENIPAATQLFTPHWIVRYLVENSLGRLWLLNRPASKLAERMDYYIAPEEPETEFLKIGKPEEIKVCDPACGSGHMLTYAFDLLYAIYEEEGYEADKIPALILQHNLTGIEIDDRAGALAAFALAMKAAARLGRRRFLRMEVKPDIVVLKNVSFTTAEMQEVLAVVGRDMFTNDFSETLGQFDQAKNFGSLIVPKLRDPAETLRVVAVRDLGGDLLLKEMQERVIAVLRMAEALSPKYHVVVANPPYMGGKGMNGHVSEFIKLLYPDEKSDLYAAFITRGYRLLNPKGLLGMVTMESWMFLSSFAKFRARIMDEATIYAMLHMPYVGKGRTSMGINFGTTAFISERANRPNLQGDYRCVRYYESDEQGVPLRFPPENERANKVSQAEFSKVPGSPIAYWLSKPALEAFKCGTLGDLFNTDGQNKTSNNDKYMRLIWEVNARAVGRSKKWLICAKGGDFRKWYGNLEHLIDWSEEARSFYRKDFSARILSEKYWYQEGITWTDLTSASTAFRVLPEGTTFETKGPSLFPYDKNHSIVALAYLNSKMVRDLLKALNPTMSTKINEVRALPIIRPQLEFQDASEPVLKSSWEISAGCA